MKIFKRIVYFTTSIIAVFIVIATTYFSYIIIKAYNTPLDPMIEALIHPEITRIYSEEEEEIKLLGIPDAEEAKFSDLPDVFIYALLSAEDNRFFTHDGVDIYRLMASAIKNIQQMKFAQGASTLTQQLIKNKKLTNQKSLVRKLTEIFLAQRLENQLSKEEIFMLYVNQIKFDGVKPGINHACQRYFSKNINEITLAQAALLVAMVKSPTLYNPINKAENANDRKNLILEMMYKNNYINESVKNNAQSSHVNDILDVKINQVTYEYQSYLDVVYQEVEQLTGSDPYTVPMRIYTNMNKQLQEEIDLIQKNEHPEVNFRDEELQVGGVVIDNDGNAIIGVLGGKDYEGERIFNRASDMIQQPASTIKPILSYALAMDNLGWSDQHVVVDEPYYFANSDKEVRNADRIHMGELTLEQALGYSRNTAALSTLDSVMNKIGRSGVVSYLDAINLLDVPAAEFNTAYGIGAMVHGVSPIALAEAYKVLPNGGMYQKASTIKRIEIIETGQVITSNYDSNRVLSSETTYKLSEVLSGVISKNYWGIGAISLPNTTVYGKTGTSSFDSDFADDMGYPSNASKDIWIAGYTADYTCTVWAGFDKFKEGNLTYFSSGDSRKSIPKNIFNTLMEDLKVKKRNLDKPGGLVKRRIIKGFYPYTIADESIPEAFATYSYFKENERLNTTLPVPEIQQLSDPSVLIYGNLLDLEFPELIKDDKKKANPNYRTIFSYENIYGNLGYVVEIVSPSGAVEKIRSLSPNITYYFLENGTYQISAYYSYFNKEEFKSNIYKVNLDSFSFE